MQPRPVPSYISLKAFMNCPWLTWPLGPAISAAMNSHSPPSVDAEMSPSSTA